MRAPITKETPLEKYFTDALEDIGIKTIKGNSKGIKGFPDRIVFAHQIFYIELKVGKEGGSYYKQTPMQKYWEKIITKSNGLYRLLEGQKQVDDFIFMIKEVQKLQKV